MFNAVGVITGVWRTSVTLSHGTLWTEVVCLPAIALKKEAAMPSQMPPGHDLLDVLADLEHEARERVRRDAHIVEVPAGQRLYRPEQNPDSFVVLLSGGARVQHVSEGGREIVLYRIAPGQSCSLTTACILADEPFAAEAIAEEACRIAAIPRAAFDDLLRTSPAFRQYVFKGFSARFTALFHVIDDVAFARNDIRLAQRLVALAGAAGVVTLTHRQLAIELGTAREVVSRLLGQFQRHGWIATARGQIELTDRAALARLAGIQHG